MSTPYSSTPGHSRTRPWRRWTLVDDESERDNGSQENTSQEALERDLLAEKERRIEELTEDIKRVQADFENYKKRVDKEWTERSRVATQKLVTDLLAVLDSFDKALQDSDDVNSPEDARRGLEGIHRQLLQVLKHEGLREINAEGRFDPFLHEALMREEREGAEDGEILEVFQKGYQLGSKTIRPARVKVARAKVPGDQSERDEVQDNEGTDSQDN
jgi:molecular chaperone GrpE